MGSILALPLFETTPKIFNFLGGMDGGLDLLPSLHRIPESNLLHSPPALCLKLVYKIPSLPRNLKPYVGLGLSSRRLVQPQSICKPLNPLYSPSCSRKSPQEFLRTSTAETSKHFQLKKKLCKAQYCNRNPMNLWKSRICVSPEHDL